MSEVITLAHGSGGKVTQNLIAQVFYKHFANEILQKGDDAACVRVPSGTDGQKGTKLAYTTDSFVISPIFFRGGDIGKLSICGTVNDLTTSGAKPLALSCGFIIEEGFPVADLEKIVESMARTASECHVKIVTGDTKVVPKGAADGIFINTSGIGIIADDINISASNAKPGDLVIITGTIGDHGCSVLLEREELNINSEIKSDCAPLNILIENVLKETSDIHVLRDPTRGGLATALNEIASQSRVGMIIDEEKIPVKNEVRGVCELLGMEPLYMANEGKMIVIVPADKGNLVLETLKKNALGREASIIGEVTQLHEKRVIMKTAIGGTRIVDMLTGDQLPRIC